MIVQLTELELALATFVAEQRNAAGRAAGADAAKYGYSGSQFDLHLQGCLGELAFAKGTGRYWSGAGCDYHSDDDVGHIQVRTSKLPHGHLLVRPTEGHEDKPWVLVVGEFPTFHVIGWCFGREAKREEWLRSPNGRPPAYFVPQKSLRPVLER